MERMPEYERKVQLVLVDAGVRDYAHLHRIIEEREPGLVKDPSTIWRYLYRPPHRLHYRIVKAIADVLETTPEAIVELVSESDGATRMLSHDETEALPA